MSKKMSTREQVYCKRLGAKIAEKRKLAELTQEQVADELELGKEAVSRIERGDVSPTAYRIYEFARLFDTPVQNFFIESSKRPIDQVERITDLLKPLKITDRTIIMNLVEQLSDRFKEEQD